MRQKAKSFHVISGAPFPSKVAAHKVNRQVSWLRIITSDPFPPSIGLFDEGSGFGRRFPGYSGGTAQDLHLIPYYPPSDEGTYPLIKFGLSIAQPGGPGNIPITAEYW